MRKGEKQAKIDDEEEEGTHKEEKFVVDLSDDEDGQEANEDLSLKIVEKSVSKRTANRDTDENGLVNLCDDTKSEDNGEAVVGGVTKSSSSSSLETEAIVEGPDGVTKQKRKKKKKKVRSVDGGEQSVITIDDEDRTELVKEGDKVDEKTEQVQDAGLVEHADPSSVEISDNIVLKKLLRGPRYFDTPDSGWPRCFKCGEDGHMAVNCTTSKKRKPCFVCGGLDHCPKQCAKGRDCYICRTAGHRAKNCPERQKGTTQSFKICMRCGGSGHEMFTCKNSYCAADLQEVQCYVCKSFGHLCCVNHVANEENVPSCYKCGAVGHNGMACSRVSNQSASAVADTTASPSSCYRCGEGGHFARDCTTPSMASKRNRVLSAPTVKSRQETTMGQNSAPPDIVKARKKRKTKKQKGGLVTENLADEKTQMLHQKAAPPPTPPPQKKSKQSGGFFCDLTDNDSDSKPQKKSKQSGVSVAVSLADATGSKSTALSQKKQKGGSVTGLPAHKSGSKPKGDNHQKPQPPKKKSKKKGGFVTEHQTDHSGSKPQSHNQKLPPFPTPPSKKLSKQKGAHVTTPTPPSFKTPKQRGGWVTGPPITPPSYQNHNLHMPTNSQYYSRSPQYHRFPSHHSPAPPYQTHLGTPPFQGGHQPGPYHHHEQQQRFHHQPLPFPGGRSIPFHQQHQHQNHRFSGPPPPFQGGGRQPMDYHQQQHRFPASRFGSSSGSEYGSYPGSYDHNRYRHNYDWR